VSNVWHKRVRGSLRRTLKRAALAAVTPIKRLPLAPPNRRPLTKVVATTKLWVESSGDKFGATYVPIHPPHVVDRGLSGVDPAVLRRFRVGPFGHSETYVATIPGGRTLGVDGAVLSPEGHLLMDVSHRREKPLTEFREMLWLRLPPVETYRGAVAVLGVRHCGNYYHWLLDVLPRIELIRLAGVAVDRYVVSITHAFQRDTLRMLGIRDEQIICPHKRSHIQAERLVVPSLPGIVGNTPTWVGEFLRSAICPVVEGHLPHTGPRRRLYVSRRNAKLRRIVNEAEIRWVFAAHGVETIESEKLSAADQIALFMQAELVIAPHGAGLTNMVFCENPCAVVELHGEHNVNDCYWALAAARDLHYLPRLLPQEGDDLVANPCELDATLREAISLVQDAAANKSAVAA
jgi:capsular polysaccharide biosynthesis protein